MIRDRDDCSTKKEQGGVPCSKNCVDPIFPQIRFDVDLAG
jgi:hypothetical protein